MEQVLDKGAKHNFLTASITCHNDSNPATEDEYTPLHYAAARGLLALVSTLVEKQNIPVNTQNHKNKSAPLHLASSRGHLDVVQFLVDQGADPNLIDSEGGSALHYAAAGRRGEMNKDIIAYLIEKGADFKKTIDPSTSMLDMAVLVSNMPVIEYWEDNYIKSSDSDIDMLTHRALELAKYKLKKDAQGREIQARIIRILKNFLKVRRTNTKGADAAQ